MHVIAYNEIYYIVLQIHYMSLHSGGFTDVDRRASDSESPEPGRNSDTGKLDRHRDQGRRPGSQRSSSTLGRLVTVNGTDPGTDHESLMTRIIIASAADSYGRGRLMALSALGRPGTTRIATDSEPPISLKLKP